ncbi:hypothetical protein JXA32_12600 [Candidatus Sumerlaeota bacterium]|nr:hypothetical protein [Candidatus Sumerlaeota bacterium]
MKYCHACGQEWTEHRQPGRREECDACGAPWRCCLNCSNYDSAKANACALRNTNPPSEKAGSNDCDEFLIADRNPQDRLQPADPAKRKEELQKKWDSLFKQ